MATSLNSQFGCWRIKTTLARVRFRPCEREVWKSLWISPFWTVPISKQTMFFREEDVTGSSAESNPDNKTWTDRQKTTHHVTAETGTLQKSRGRQDQLGVALQTWMASAIEQRRSERTFRGASQHGVPSVHPGLPNARTQLFRGLNEPWLGRGCD